MRTTLALTLAGILAVAACTRTNTTSTTATNDSELEQAIQDRFRVEAALRDSNLSVDADLKDNEVTVSGTVSSEAMRSRAVGIVEAARPGVKINDKIDVKPPDAPTAEVPRDRYTEEMASDYRRRVEGTGSKIGRSLDDAWIHTKITTRLAADSDTPARKINVDVEDNVVTLRGTVATAAAKQEAERIVRQTEGVKRINNLLRVQPS
jgi:osmotically-inducible protein OsmY